MTGPAAPTPVRGARRALYLALAALFFVLGALGAVLPGLPTTPFLLLTSACLVRSSPRLHRALLGSRLFGPLLRDWQQHRGVRRPVKARAVLVILAFAGAAAAFSDLPAAARGAVFGLALIGVTVVLRLREIPAEASPADASSVGVPGGTAD